MIALLLFGVGLYVIGSILEGHEKAQRDAQIKRDGIKFLKECAAENQAVWDEFDRDFPDYWDKHPDEPDSRKRVWDLFDETYPGYRAQHPNEFRR